MTVVSEVASLCENGGERSTGFIGQTTDTVLSKEIIGSSTKAGRMVDGESPEVFYESPSVLGICR